MRKRTTILHWPPIRKESSTRPAQSSRRRTDRKSTRLNSSHDQISYAVFCLKKKKRHKSIQMLPKHELGHLFTRPRSQLPTDRASTSGGRWSFAHTECENARRMCIEE